MLELIHIAVGIAERSFLFSIITMSVHFASRVIKFDNLSIEGAFTLGGACTALLISQGIHPGLSMLVAISAGMLSGIATGLLHTTLKISPIISGIVITAGLFSINLKIAGPTIVIANPTIFSSIHPFILLIIICQTLFFILKWFLNTEFGLVLYAIGDSPQMVLNIGKNINFHKIVGITLCNALSALCGSIFVQYTGYFSIWTGIGILVIGIASMMLAELFSHRYNEYLIIGSLVYQSIIALTFELQLDQDLNRFITALLIIGIILSQKLLYKK